MARIEKSQPGCCDRSPCAVATPRNALQPLVYGFESPSFKQAFAQECVQAQEDSRGRWILKVEYA